MAGHDSVIVSSGPLRRAVAVTVSAGRPSVIDIVTGERQSGVAGGALTEPVVARVRDAYGNAVVRSSVNFRAESGGNAVPATATTDATGSARVLWTLGPLAGTQSLVVVADSASATVEATARAGVMVRVADLEPIVRRTNAGDTVAVRLRALDGFGNGVAGVVFAFSVAAGGGEVVPPRVESDSTGLVETRWRTGTDAGPNALQVRAIQVRDTTFRLVVRTIGGVPVAVQLVSGDGQRAAAQTAVRRPPVVRVVDRHGNPVSAVHIRFIAALPSQVQPQELVTDDRGEATPREWILGAPGEQLLLVVAQGVRDTLRVRARALTR
ncbi:MAG: Ig-like domain-containing protein [Gemmatimonadetes bacterium]|nr:Ig-like domain-containing protein [Gemmatimonadota bacterium]